MNQQLPLSVYLRDESSLANFCWHGNALLRDQLLAVLANHGERMVYLWGHVGSGKSHILQACCQSICHNGQSGVYLPLNFLKEWGPQILEGMQEHTLIAIDDIDAIAADSDWEEALFHLYNQIRDQDNTILIITSQLPPAHSQIRLPDLRSRLMWGLVFQLNELHDEDKVNTLQLRAQKRGLKLSATVCQYLINRCARNMHDLHMLLDRLDEASLIAQRRITIPFVKEVLEI